MRNNDFCDVTLVRRDNQQLEVHKVILSAYINVFKNMLASNKHPHPMIFTRGVSHEVFQSLLDFIYCRNESCQPRRRRTWGDRLSDGFRHRSPEEEVTKEVKASVVKGLKVNNGIKIWLKTQKIPVSKTKVILTAHLIMQYWRFLMLNLEQKVWKGNNW